MNSNAKRWVAALRSGEFKQGKGKMKCNDGSVCCLGAACLLAKSDGICEETEDGIFDGQSKYLPKSVQDWLGLASNNGRYGFDPHMKYLAYQNDFELSFDQIADLIESEPPGLFVEASK